MIIDVIGLMLYLTVGAVAGGIANYAMRKEEGDARAVVSMAALIAWPLAIVVMILGAILVATHRGLAMIGRSIGARRNRAQILYSTVSLMEADQERVGTSTDIALSWSYTPCPICFGSGCRECSDYGVVRRKADGTIVNSHGRPW